MTFFSYDCWHITKFENYNINLKIYLKTNKTLLLEMDHTLAGSSTSDLQRHLVECFQRMHCRCPSHAVMGHFSSDTTLAGSSASELLILITIQPNFVMLSSR